MQKSTFPFTHWANNFQSEYKNVEHPYFCGSHIFHSFYEHLVGLVRSMNIFVEMLTTNHTQRCFYFILNVSVDERLLSKRTEEKHTVTGQTMQFAWFIPTTVNELTLHRITYTQNQFLCLNVIKLKESASIVCEHWLTRNFSISM